MPQTQGQLLDVLQNRMHNPGIYLIEKEVEYNGEKIVLYAILPHSLAGEEDNITEALASPFEEIEGDQEEGEEVNAQSDEEKEDDDMEAKTKTKYPIAKKTATKKAAPKKSTQKK